MQTITVSAKTTQDAIAQGLQQLNATREDVFITVIQEGRKGLFGFGKQDALVSLTLKPKVEVSIDEPVVEVNEIVEPLEIEESVIENETPVVEMTQENNQHDNKYAVAVDYLTHIAKEYGADVTVNIHETSKKLEFQVETTKAGLLIGKYGKIINALQVLVQTIVYRDFEKAPMVVVNIGDYRQKREEKLKEMANRTAKKVIRTRQSVYLEPLPAFERKIVHAYISQYEQLVTQSEGKEPHRYLKVSYDK